MQNFYMRTIGLRRMIRRTPYVGALVMRLKRLFDPLPQKDAMLHFSRLDPEAAPTEAERQKYKVLNVIRYTQNSRTAYAAVGYPAAYHTIQIGNEVIEGQRDPVARLAAVSYDSSGKTLLDIGCNQGGMLFALSEQIKYGIGIDYDSNMINAANRIRALKQTFALLYIRP